MLYHSPRQNATGIAEQLCATRNFSPRYLPPPGFPLLDGPLGGAAAVILKQGAGLLGQVLLAGAEHRHGVFFLRAPAVYVLQALLYILAGLVLM